MFVPLWFGIPLIAFATLAIGWPALILAGRSPLPFPNAGSRAVGEASPAAKATIPDQLSNVSVKGQAVRLELSAPYIALIDPLALDGLRDKLRSLEGRTSTEQRQLLKALSAPLRIGVHEVKNFRPGAYRVAPNDFEPVQGQGADDGIVDIDSGAVVVADLAHLARVAQVLTWERYDRALQAPEGDHNAFRTITGEVGGPFFAILAGTVNTSFQGDGAYRLRRAAFIE